MDLDGIEAVTIRALGGTDTVTVNDLTGTDVENVDVDLAATGGGGDGVPDSVVVNGTDRRDVVQVTRSGAQIRSPASRPRRDRRQRGSHDTLRIQTLDGNDDVTVDPDVGAADHAGRRTWGPGE